MWPRVLAQIVELLPHLSRLVPLADRFLLSRQAGDEANREALAQVSVEMQAIADGLKADLGQVTASHAGLYRQMNEIAAKADDAARDARAARDAAASLEAKLAGVAATQARLQMLLTVAVVLLAIVVLLLPFLFHAAAH